MAKFNYDKAMTELQDILADIQSDNTGLESLSKKIKRAKELLSKCKDRLRHIEEDVTESLYEEE